MSAAEVSLDLREPEVIIRCMINSNRAIDDFLSDCRARGWSERSITSYAATLYSFADRLPADLDVSKITPDDLRRYRASRQRHIARNSLAGEEAHLASWLRYLYQNGKIAGNPMDKLERTKRTPPDELEVVSVSTPDVPKLLTEAKPGGELNALAILAYLGPRRHAVAMLRLSDYEYAEPYKLSAPPSPELLAEAERFGIDLAALTDAPVSEASGPPKRTLRFREKGGKTIVKPVPDELAAILDASIARGDIKAAPDDYLVPPEGFLHRVGDRDDRVIWRLVKKVAGRAGIEAHVHSLRAAFAVFYLERNPDDLLGLKDLLGHRSLNTTLIYLRRRNKQAGMERVRDLSWLSQSPPTPLVTSLAMGAGGFEPPSEDDPSVATPDSEHLAVASEEPLDQALLQTLLKDGSTA